MYDWTAQFSKQRRDYIRRTIERLAAMQELLSAIATRPEDLKPLRDLAQHFHQLAGSSAIYELDNLGKNASEGERLCLAVLKNNSILKADWKLIKDNVDAMQFTCSQHPDSHGYSIAPTNQQLDAPLATPQSDAQGKPNTTWSAEQKQTASWETQRSSGNWVGGTPTSPFVGNAYQKPKDIIMVDGDQASMMTLTRALENEGMHVRGYRTTDGAKKAIQERLPDALILGVPLIDGPGYDVAHFLRSLPDGNVPPILILSRKIGFLDKVMAIRCGADAFFNEVSEPAAILSKLNTLLERDKQDYTILSVEDDSQQAEFVKGILASVGYRVHVIRDPRQFEEALLAVNPDLILLDVVLGPVSGFELARFVRSDDRFAATPIIFLTTQNQLDAHVESARVGGDEHLIKPIAPPLLIATVAGRLERYRVVKKLIGRDALTQFYTLSTFMETAEKMLAKKYQIGSSVVLLMVDVDHMELINERYGFAAGDKVISSLAKLLKNRLRNAEVFARLGGDDFAIIMDEIDDRDLATIATQLIEEFESLEHTANNGQPFKATISAGAAALEGDMNLKAWLSNAQLALRSAKSGGRNRVMKAKSRART
jgi:diguanylate cyclase (GGDEF)-like protein